MKVYDNYEISPCRRFEEPDSPGKHYFEVCEPAEADVWTLYGHINGKGVEAIGDFPTREAAAEVYSRITGRPFAGSYQADAHLRVMHAGPKLLAALIDLLGDLPSVQEGKCHHCGREYHDVPNGDCPSDDCPSFNARSAIPEATGGSPLEPLKPSAELDIHELLASRGQIALGWSVEDVQEVRPDLTEQQSWEVLQQVKRQHDATAGVTWDTLEWAAKDLFGSAPETAEEEE